MLTIPGIARDPNAIKQPYGRNTVNGTIATGTGAAYFDGMPRLFLILALAAALAAPSLRAQSLTTFTGVPFRSDLEDVDADCFLTRPAAGCSGWTGIHDAAITLGVDEKAHSGRKALRIEFLKNEDFAGTTRKTEARRIFTRFYDYYDSGFDFAAGMKIHRLSSFNEARQLNDFDIILQLKADAPDANYCGLTDAKYIALTYNGGPNDWGSVEARFTPERGRWYAVETEVWLNSPGLSDGEARIWIDGRLVAEKKGMDIRGKLTTVINRVMFGGWYSNAAAGRNPCPNPINPSRRYVDDPAIAGTYIGLVAATPAVPGPGPGPRKPAHRPRNLPAHDYDPIPD
jgi:hypothetical protein